MREFTSSRAKTPDFRRAHTGTHFAAGHDESAEPLLARYGRTRRGRWRGDDGLWQVGKPLPALIRAVAPCLAKIRARDFSTGLRRERRAAENVKRAIARRRRREQTRLAGQRREFFSRQVCRRRRRGQSCREKRGGESRRHVEQKHARGQSGGVLTSPSAVCAPRSGRRRRRVCSLQFPAGTGSINERDSLTPTRLYESALFMPPMAKKGLVSISGNP